MEAFWVSDLKKATSQLSLGKNYPSISFRKKFKFCNLSFIKAVYGTDFQRCHICCFFSKAKPSVQRMRSKMVGGLQKTAPCAKIMLDFNLSELCELS